MPKVNSWNYLRIGNWVFFLSGVMSFTLLFGVIAILKDKDESQYATCILFVIACIVCVAIMVIQKNWRIKYNCAKLYFRNSFGFTTQYEIDRVSIIDDKRMTRIIYDDKVIIEWDTMIVNLQEDIALHRFLNHK